MFLVLATSGVFHGGTPAVRRIEVSDDRWFFLCLVAGRLRTGARMVRQDDRPGEIRDPGSLCTPSNKPSESPRNSAVEHGPGVPGRCELSNIGNIPVGLFANEGRSTRPTSLPALGTRAGFTPPSDAPDSGSE